MNFEILFYIMVIVKIVTNIDIPLWLILAPLFFQALLYLTDSVKLGFKKNDLSKKSIKKIHTV